MELSFKNGGKEGEQQGLSETRRLACANSSTFRVVELAEPTVFPKAVTPSAYSQGFLGSLVRMKYDVAFN